MAVNRKLNSRVKIVEVGLRDGLQNESTFLSLEQRYDIFEKLVGAGIKNIEIGSFVSPKWVPQMAVTAELCGLVLSESRNVKKNKVIPSVLVPNLNGMEQALQFDIEEIAIFAACSESFSKKNINCTIEESFERFKPVVELAKAQGMRVRGYLSTCFYCPFEGKIPVSKVVRIAKKMKSLGVYEVSIGDTIGAATPSQVTVLFNALKKVIPVKMLAGHFHDTRGLALVNIMAAFQSGVRVFDSSIGGLGGCPYAPNATGNVATEDVVYMLEGAGIKTGIQLQKIIEITNEMKNLFDHPLSAKVSKVGLLKPLGAVK